MIDCWEFIGTTVKELPGEDSKNGKYQLDAVYDVGVNNETISRDLLDPAVQKAVEGFNGTFFVYGDPHYVGWRAGGGAHIVSC